MAEVNLTIGSVALRSALDNLFNDANVSSYTITLANDDGVIAGLSDTCTFGSAQYDITDDFAYIKFITNGSVYFYVDKGTTINKLNLYATVISPTGSKTIISEAPIETRTYTANGTYTVSDIIIKIGE